MMPVASQGAITFLFELLSKTFWLEGKRPRVLRGEGNHWFQSMIAEKAFSEITIVGVGNYGVNEDLRGIGHLLTPLSVLLCSIAPSGPIAGERREVIG